MEKFKEVYSALYNSASTEAEMAELMAKVSELIRPACSEEIGRVTGQKSRKSLVN